MVSMFMLILCMSGLCLGMRTITSENMFAHGVREWFEQDEHIPLFVKKPLIICVACMSSIWGSTVFWVYHLNKASIVDQNLITDWVYSCLVCSFINALLWSIYQKCIR